MMSHRLSKLARGQRGFTLIELMVALVISALIGSGIGTAIYQTLTVSARSTAYMTAVKQLENAVQWLSRDVQMAQNVVPGPGSGFPVTLSWIEWDSDESIVVTYAISDGDLRRSKSGSGGPPTETVVAKYLDASGSSCAWEPVMGRFTFELKATVRQGSQLVSETRVGEILPRPSR